MSEHPALAALLTVEPVSGEPVSAGAAGGAAEVTAPNAPTDYGRLYGGQLLAQALLAAFDDGVPAGRAAHSLHAYFHRGGATAAPLVYRTTRTFDGGSFTHRRTDALQDGQAIFSADTSFQAPATGPTHSTPAPDVPDPEELPPITERAPAPDDPPTLAWVAEQPGFEYRFVDRDRVDPSVTAVWVRAREPLPEDPRIQQAALAYASDFTIRDHAFTRQGMGEFDPTLQMTSLDHAIWWHAPARADAWMLHVQESSHAGDGRGRCEARIYDRERNLAASVVQEFMFRRR